MDDKQLAETITAINTMILELYTRQIAMLSLLSGSLPTGAVRDSLESARDKVDHSPGKHILLSQTDPKSLREAAELLRALR